MINNFYNKGIKQNNLFKEKLFNTKNDFKNKSNLEEINKIKENTFQNISNYKFNSNDISSEDLIFNQNINDKYIKDQIYFCDNQTKFYNQKFEDNIKLVDIDFRDKKYNMYVYRYSDMISNIITNSKSWEGRESKNLLKALDYYSNKKNIKNEDIYIIDIGANIGWYSITLGKYGFKIISFEPSPINYYILKKNYCLNKEINVTIINKGLYNEEKKCILYNQLGNKGNGLVKCDNFSNFNDLDSRYPFSIKTGEIILTKLSNYIPFLSDKNLAMIKIDIEGSEAKAIEGGIELITKYHIPFIFLEFTCSLLKIQNNDPVQFLQLFVDNGYKISLSNFIDKNYISIDDVIKSRKRDLYLIFKHI